MRLYFLTLKIAAFFRRRPKQPVSPVQSSGSNAATTAVKADSRLLAEFAQRQRQLVVAENTRPADEYLLARYMTEHPEACLVLAPDRADVRRLHRIFNLFHGRYIRFSEAEPRNLQTCRMVLMDTAAVPACLYEYARAAYAGGGFNSALPASLPAADYHLPTVFGSYSRNHPMAAEVADTGIGIAVSNYKELAQTFNRLLTDEHL